MLTPEQSAILSDEDLKNVQQIVDQVVKDIRDGYRDIRFSSTPKVAKAVLQRYREAWDVISLSSDGTNQSMRLRPSAVTENASVITPEQAAVLSESDVEQISVMEAYVDGQLLAGFLRFPVDCTPKVSAAVFNLFVSSWKVDTIGSVWYFTNPKDVRPTSPNICNSAGCFDDHEEGYSADDNFGNG